MNKLYLFYGFLLCLLFHFPVQAQVQSGTVTYRVKADKEAFEESLKGAKEYEGSRRYWFAKIRNGLPYLKYTLKFNTETAIFQEERGMAIHGTDDVDFASTFSGGKGDFYFDLKKEQTFQKIHELEEDLIIYRYLKDLNWEITGETKEIQGYKCYKAIIHPSALTLLGKNAVAWFTPELPFQFGPMIYGGLPGLILEAKRDIFTFYATSIKLSPSSHKIKRPTGGIEISTAEFKKRSDEYINKRKKKLKAN